MNCLLPGAVFTEINQRAGLMDDETALQRLQGMSDLHALGRIGTTEEIAEALLKQYGSIPNLLKTKVRIKDLMKIFVWQNMMVI